MHTGIGLYRSTHLPDLKTKSSVLKRLLHLVATEEAEITTITSRAAVTVPGSQLLKCLSSWLDIVLVAYPKKTFVSFGRNHCDKWINERRAAKIATIDNTKGVFFAARDILFSPRGWTSWTSVLNQEVAAANFFTITGRFFPLRLFCYSVDVVCAS